MRRFTICFLLLTFCTAVSSQSIFEFKYYFEENKIREEYKAFLFRNDDGTGFIRVRFYDPDTKSYTVVDMDMEEQYGHDGKGHTDTNLLVFEGFNPQIIVGNKNEFYDPDIFWFERNPQTAYFEPLAVVSPSEDGKTFSQGVIESMRLLNEQDLTKELILGYFTPDDVAYKNLFVNRVRTAPAPPQPTNLYLLIVANTNDKSIGGAVAKDKKNVVNNYSTIAKTLQLGFVEKSLAGNDFNMANAEKMLSNFKPGPNDIVVFYYSGHGYNLNDAGYQYPFIDLRTDPLKEYPKAGVNSLNMEDIYKQIVAKGARLNIVISDCCNADPGLSSISVGLVNSTRPSTLAPNLNSYFALFLDKKPVSILVSAAAKGELSAGNDNDGGIFTNNFLSSVERFTGLFAERVPSWDDIIKMSKERTIAKARLSDCEMPDGKFEKCKQTPVYQIKPGNR